MGNCSAGQLTDIGTGRGKGVGAGVAGVGEFVRQSVYPPPQYRPILCWHITCPSNTVRQSPLMLSGENLEQFRSQIGVGVGG